MRFLISELMREGRNIKMIIYISNLRFFIRNLNALGASGIAFVLNVLLIAINKMADPHLLRKTCPLFVFHLRDFYQLSGKAVTTIL